MGAVLKIGDEEIVIRVLRVVCGGRPKVQLGIDAPGKAVVRYENLIP